MRSQVKPYRKVSKPIEAGDGRAGYSKADVREEGVYHRKGPHTHGDAFKYGKWRVYS